jgi:hypothetical protein
MARFSIAPHRQIEALASACGKTRQNQIKTRQDKTRQDKTRQDTTRQNKSRQNKTRQDKTKQNNKGNKTIINTGQDKAIRHINTHSIREIDRKREYRI